MLWHGTDEGSARTIEQSGIEATPRRPGLDFGPGFYVTSKRRQAEDWADLRVRKLGLSTSALVGFEVFYEALGALMNVSFVRMDRNAAEFWTFVGRMKSGAFSEHFEGGCYDVVSGPVTLRPSRFLALPDSDQFSFHGEQGLAFINGCRKSFHIPSARGTFAA